MSDRGALRLGGLAVLICVLAARAQYLLYAVDVGDHPNALAVDTIDHTVYVSCEGSDSVYVLDAFARSPEEAVVARLPVGDYPVDVVWNPVDNTMWVVNKEVSSPNGSVTVVDAGNDSVLTTIGVGAAPFKAVWASVGNKMYALGSGIVAAIDCSTSLVVGWIGVPEPEVWHFTDMVYNPSMNRLYLTAKERTGQGGLLYVVDCAIDHIIQSVDVSYGAVKIAYAPSVNRAFIACSEQRTMDVFDCASNAVIAWLPTNRNPRAVLWTPPPVNRVWVACGLQGHAVHYMRADLLEIEGRVDTEDSTPSSLLYNPHAAQVMVACELEHEILWINARIPSLGILNRLDLAAEAGCFGPYGLVLYPHTGRVFVANYWNRDPGKVAVLLCFLGIEGSPDRQSLLPSRAMPNPVGPGSRVVLQASGFEPVRATLVDVTGRSVYESGLVRNGAMIAPEEPGVYFYTVTDGCLTSSGKFTVR
ncbi:MAG: hypothetical protein JSU73_11615 [candidate division WOR-3 bacterium]|nr:MAG: hypothetical protein JSU73_11615 [candidate division WOR-3 bacterium]